MGARTSTASARALELVHTDPSQSRELAAEILRRTPELSAEHAEGLWAMGLVRREEDDLDGANEDLRRASEIAHVVGRRELGAEIDVSRALVLAYLGDSETGLRLLAGAVPSLDRTGRARATMQQGLIEQRRGNLDAALDLYEASASGLEDDPIAAARLHANLAALYVYRDRPEAAIEHCERASELAGRSGQTLLQAGALHNLGYARGHLADFAGALDAFSKAQQLYSQLPLSPMALSLGIDHANVLRAANLVDEARAIAHRAVDDIRRAGNTTDLADALLLQSECCRAGGDHVTAIASAAEAASLFETQGRTAWVPVARLAVLLAEDAAAAPATAPSEDPAGLAAELESLNWSREAAEAWLLSARRHVEAGRPRAAAAELARLDAVRRRGSPLERAAHHHAWAIVDRALDDEAGARRHVRAGLRLLAEHRESLGSTELRVAAVGHARRLREVGQRGAISSGRPRDFLLFGESSVGLVDLLPGPEQGDEVEQRLSSLRVVLRRLGTAAAEGDSVVELERRRADIERSIRELARRDRRRAMIRLSTAADLRDVIGLLGRRSAVVYGVVDDEIWAGSVVRGRATLHDLAPVADLRALLDSLAFALNRLQRREVSEASRSAALSGLSVTAGEIADLLIPARVRSASQVLVVPSSAVGAVPWTSVGASSGQELVVTPSLASWRRASDGRGSRRRGVLTVDGPGLEWSAVESAAVASEWGPATICSTGRVEDVTREIAGKRVVHLACHGRFRADNPMFSSLLLRDGEMTLFDVERSVGAPGVVVMSSCSAGREAAVDEGATLGFATAMLQLGASSVIAPVAPVNDERSVDLMRRLHALLAAGATPGAALAEASTLPDGTLDPVAAPFVCFGS